MSPKQRLSGEVGLGHVDARAAKRDALVLQQSTLAGSLRKGAIGAHDAMPGNVGGVEPRERVARQARRFRAQIPVGGDEALGEPPHKRQDGLASIIEGHGTMMAIRVGGATAGPRVNQ